LQEGGFCSACDWHLELRE